MSPNHSHTPRVAVSVIVPVLNERAAIGELLPALRRQLSDGDELIVVDGGSTDGTPDLAGQWADRLMSGEPGRARQMNAGAEAATGDVLWFLHADSTVPDDAVARLRDATGDGARWGWFRVRLSGSHRAFRVIERFMRWRSALTGIATGDQGIFVRADLFRESGGYPEIPLMEDVTLSGRLRRESRPVRCPSTLVASSRRWERDGIGRTVWLMWRLRFAWWRGADPAELARRYYGKAEEGSA